MIACVESVHDEVADVVEVLRVFLVSDELLEMAGIIVNQQVGLDLLHSHDGLEKLDFLLIILILTMFYRSKNTPTGWIHCELPSCSSLRQNQSDTILGAACAASVTLTQDLLCAGMTLQL